MKILITGGAGFIGSSLALELISQRHEVTVLDNLSKQIHGENPKEASPLYNLIRDKVYFVEGDVRNIDDWSKALPGQEAVVHLAAETGTGQSMYQVNHYTDVNVSGTNLMFEALRQCDNSVSRIVIASSRAVYGEGAYRCVSHGLIYPDSRLMEDMENGTFDVKCPECGDVAEAVSTKENSFIKPSSIYGLTKYVQEQTCLILGKSMNIPVVALRYQNVYGPGQSLSNPYTGILSIFSKRLLSNKTVNIFEDGEESRDFVYIKDVVAATVASITSELSENKIFNVGSGEETTVKHVAEELKTLYKSNSVIEVTGNFRVGDIRTNLACLDKIKSELGYQPLVSFKEGIKEFSNWVLSQELSTDLYEESIIELKSRGLLK